MDGSVLKVAVVKAENIADVDFAFAGKTDPYVVVEISGQHRQTEMLQGNLNPVWNAEFDFKVKDPESEVVNFILWDSDVGQDTMVASCSVNLNSLVQGQKRGWELPLLRVGPKGASCGTLTVELLATNFSGLKVTMDKLNEDIAKLEAVTAGLHTTESDLRQQVAQLTETEGRLKAEVGRLEGLERTLTERVASFSQKLKVMESTVQDLKQTRDSLNHEVSEMEGQNEKLKSQLEDLNSIKESMKTFAETAGEDFDQFVQQLTGLVERNQEQIDEFAEQNRKLKANRLAQQVNSLLQMSMTFQNWDAEAGLSSQEFEQYVSFLGPEYEQRIRSRLDASGEDPFGKLDQDGNGNLNLEEVRNLLNDLVKEVEAEGQC
mmetsp:Transcript_141759/g.395239  ORF Transcript_141759/g.395239 Transcript_141759/m.395239 type:complete len:376 (-) Transcript_141759:135-1262(-)